jgi:hypothetical protein
MFRHILSALLIFLSASAQARITIRFDDQAARATLAALEQPNLPDRAVAAVAENPGNIALIRQANRFDKNATPAAFLKALREISNGARLELQNDPLRLQSVVDTMAEVKRLLSSLSADKASIEERVRSRVAIFSPNDVDLRVTVVLVAGGTSDGWAPAPEHDSVDQKFYISLNMFKGDMGGVELLLSHELYHVVQSYAERDISSRLEKAISRSDSAALSLLKELTREGTASLVGDATVWPTDGQYVQWYRRKFAFNIDRISQIAFLAESVLLHVARDGPPEANEGYNLLFSASWDSSEYFLGYYMAKFIYDRSGPSAIADIVSSPDPTELVRRYVIAVKTDTSTKPAVTFSDSFVQQIERLGRSRR